jgi:hypothetical protein
MVRLLIEWRERGETSVEQSGAPITNFPEFELWRIALYNIRVARNGLITRAELASTSLALPQSYLTVNQDEVYMKHFIKENGGLIALLVVIATGIWWIQSTIVKGQIEQQKQFTEMIEKIGNVEKQSILRDHKLELELERIKLAKN